MNGCVYNMAACTYDVETRFSNHDPLMIPCSLRVFSLNERFFHEETI